MSDVVHLGLGVLSDRPLGREDVQRQLHQIWSRLYTRQSQALEDRAGRSMGEGVDSSEVVDACAVNIARDVFGVLSDVEFGKLMDRVRRRKEAA